jgi:cell wall assembly regulator SMI1
LYEFDTWAPMLRIVRQANPTTRQWGSYIGPDTHALPLPDASAASLAQMSDALVPIRQALKAAGKDEISFTVRIAENGHAVVTPRADPLDVGIHREFGYVVLSEQVAPLPGLHEPRTYPGRGPAPSADPQRLERILRERMPDAVGASDKELDDLEERLGVQLPAELRAVLRVTRGNEDDYGPYGEDPRHESDLEALGGIALFGLDGIERASKADVRKGMPLDDLARAAVITRSDSAVQGLVDSPNWIVIGDHGGGSGDWVAIDLSPGPAGHIGQLVVLDHEYDIGADLIAESWTELVVNGEVDPPSPALRLGPPEVVMMNGTDDTTVEAAANDELEVLELYQGEPADLTPLVGLPRLRTLIAEQGSVADPLVIGDLTNLTYLELGTDDWRTLLDAGAVPSTLTGAAISGFRPDCSKVDAIYRDLMNLWGVSSPTDVTIEGDLGR